MKTWTAGLDTNDPNYVHRVLESLWFGEDEHGSYVSLRFARGQESRLDEEHFPIAAIRQALAPETN